MEGRNKSAEHCRKSKEKLAEWEEASRLEGMRAEDRLAEESQDARRRDGDAAHRFRNNGQEHPVYRTSHIDENKW